MLAEAEKGVFFYLHCSIGLRNGERYYRRCKNVRYGVETVLKPEQYPPLPPAYALPSTTPELELIEGTSTLLPGSLLNFLLQLK